MNSSKKTCLLIHGLTATPKILDPLTNALRVAGFEVVTPLLPGHGTNPEDLSVKTWHEWWNEVESAYNNIRQRSGKVCCAGISLGSLLALKLAEEKGKAIDAVIGMATPLVLDWPVEYFAYPMVKYSPARYLYKFQKKDWNGSIADPVGRQTYIENSYDKIPINSVLEIFKLKKIVVKNLSKICSPLLLVHGLYDKAAPVSNLKIAKKQIKKELLETLILKKSKHVITLDYDKDELVESILAFLTRFV